MQSAEFIDEQVQPAPLLTAAVIQVCATVAVFSLVRLDPGNDATGMWPWLAGLVAAGIGIVAGLPPWWMLINLLLPPAACFLFDAAIPAPAYFAAFVVLWLANTGAWRNRVPLYLSGRTAIAALLPLLPSRPGFHLLDLGCGTGSVLVSLASARPNGNYHGIELAPLPFLLSRWRTRNGVPPPEIKLGDFWNVDLSRYDVVYAYLSPAVMGKLWRKAQREMQPGTLLVSNDFTIPGVTPLRTISYAAQGRLCVWRM